MYTPAGREPTLAERSAAALLVLPRDGVITGVTALHLHGVELGAAEPIRVATATTGQTHRTGIRLTRIRQLPEAHGRIARPAAALAREEVDSPRETVVRLLLVLAGLPEPRCNPRIGTEHEPIGRMDLVNDPYKIITEYDGEQHRTDPRQWGRDIARHEAAVNAGYLIIRVTAGRLLQPREVATAVHARLTERGYSGPPPTFTPEWRALFETDRRL